MRLTTFELSADAKSKPELSLEPILKRVGNKLSLTKSFRIGEMNSEIVSKSDPFESDSKTVCEFSSEITFRKDVIIL